MRYFVAAAMRFTISATAFHFLRMAGFLAGHSPRDVSIHERKSLTRSP